MTGSSATAPVVIMGGAGFIGCNLARSFLADGARVLIVDNLSRNGVSQNLSWLQGLAPDDRLQFLRADITDAAAMAEAVADAGAVFCLAAQTAVTTSLEHPMADFRTNVLGTLNLLEAVRRSGRRVPLIFASTNKVYGALEDVEMVAGDAGYLPADPDLRTYGISEAQRLDFCTPYGCSKGAADQYVLDYCSSFGIPTAVLRMSCIYGPRQFGTEDQGWVAHFLIQALADQPITIYGDGQQVRDILFIDDAVAAYRALVDNIDELQGRAFNLGGGPANAVSVNTVLTEIERLVGRKPAIAHDEWRQGDQLYFTADTRRLTAAVAWQPRVGWRDGLKRLTDWLAANRRSASAEAPRRRAVA
jgi:CDP-paratose 2-epimerase